ncbi:discoidin domain-containing protein [Terrihalobacillus insolitus]|uniref:discoidin domain-containing protein n=1 Tax=Terrihalobacillus insolitus TaxID=2950438 RepID=UPI00233FD29E|nr:discoidin domain-containing protein [Terrihalobacillus insolitus]MDC3411945.1 discoidin domain-containing protein [Terrihalobacillus insolitus]
MKKSAIFALLGIVILISGYYIGSIKVESRSPSEIRVLDTEGIEFTNQDNKTIVSFTTEQPGFCQVLIGTEEGQFDRVAVESMPEGPHKEHYNVVEGLEQNTQYTYKINFTNSNGEPSQSKVATFNTAKNENVETDNMQGMEPDGQNIALLANGGQVLGVSSNFGGASNDQTWGAEKAIDGDPSSEWSSAGDGNEAWIEVGFNQSYRINTIGFWTRTMENSAEIKQIKVATLDGKEVGTYTLNGPDQIQYFEFDTPVEADGLRFEVVDSSGGNTGAVEIEIYSNE